LKYTLGYTRQRTAKEPCIHSKEPCKRALYMLKRALQKSYVYIQKSPVKEPCIRSKEPCVEVSWKYASIRVYCKKPRKRTLYILKRALQKSHVYTQKLYTQKRFLANTRQSGYAVKEPCKRALYILKRALQKSHV